MCQFDFDLFWRFVECLDFKGFARGRFTWFRIVCFDCLPLVLLSFWVFDFGVFV